MKRQDYVAILETHEEVSEVFFMPSWWGYSSGGSWCGFCAAYHILKTSEKEAEKFSIGFLNKNLEAYWDSLHHTKMFADYDFYKGCEENSDWPYRPEDSAYLLAAKHISDCGVHSFKIEKVVGDAFQAVRFTNKDGNSFMFKDTEDLRMYISAESALQSSSREKDSLTVKEELDVFIGKKYNKEALEKALALLSPVSE